MNITEINWGELKNILKIRYPILTDADLHCEEGMEQEMLRVVEYKLSKTREEMQDIIEMF